MSRERDWIVEAMYNDDDYYKHPRIAMTPAGQEMAKRIRKSIENEPSAFDMGNWCTTDLAASEEPACGTTMCIAGWAVHLAGYDISKGLIAFDRTNNTRHVIETLGATVLELPEEATGNLFYFAEGTAKKVLDVMADEGYYPSYNEISDIIDSEY